MQRTDVHPSSAVELPRIEHGRLHVTDLIVGRLGEGVVREGEPSWLGGAIQVAVDALLDTSLRIFYRLSLLLCAIIRNVRLFDPPYDAPFHRAGREVTVLGQSVPNRVQLRRGQGEDASRRCDEIADCILSVQPLTGEEDRNEGSVLDGQSGYVSLIWPLGLIRLPVRIHLQVAPSSLVVVVHERLVQLEAGVAAVYVNEQRARLTCRKVRNLVGHLAYWWWNATQGGMDGVEDAVPVPRGGT